MRPRRRTAREIASSRRGSQRSAAQLWMTVLVAVLMLAAVLFFRKGCGAQLSKVFDTLSGTRKEQQVKLSRKRPFLKETSASDGGPLHDVDAGTDGGML